MDWLKMKIQSDPKKNELFDILMQKDEIYWKKFRGSDDIFKWLRNFSTDEEVYLALVLAKNIMYYTNNHIDYLWSLILLNRVKQYLLKCLFTEQWPQNIDEWFQVYLREKCLFIGYGRAGKSGQSMLYTFKKSHGIKDLTYLEEAQLLQCSIDLNSKQFVFLIDDFIGSGNQAKDEWNEKIDGKSFDDIHKEYPDLKFVYLALVGCEKGKIEIENNTPMKVIIGEELNETFMCFSDVSAIYKNNAERKRAKEVMTEKGRMLYSRYPLGYDNLELAVAFIHNTPDNTLPVIWKRAAGWHPLFERKE
jgi:hypothetical protein